MKVTKALVRQFENEQKQFGTQTAIENIVWLIAAQLFSNIGVNRIRTSYKKKGHGVYNGTEGDAKLPKK
jgi:hypothetical protein